MYYDYISFKNLNLGIKANIIRNVKNKMKYNLVWILWVLKLEKIYLSKAGINPTNSELTQFIEYQKKFFV